MKKSFISFILIAFIIIINSFVSFSAGGTEELAVSHPSFSGDGINEYGGLKKGTVNSAVTVMNTASDCADVMLISVLTERQTGRIVDIALQTGKTAYSQPAELCTQTRVPDNGLYTLKLLCWDNNMQQLCAPYILEDYNTDEYSFNLPTLLTSFDSDETSSMYVWADTENGCSASIKSDPNGRLNSALRMDYNRQNYGCLVQRDISSDWSGYTGLRFDIKGTQNSIIYTRINDGAKTWQYEVNVTSDWQTVNIDFADFDGIKLENIKTLSFFVHSNGTEDRSGEGYFLADNIILTSPVRCVSALQVLTDKLGSCFSEDDMTFYITLCGFKNLSETVDINCELEDIYSSYKIEKSFSVSVEPDEIKEVPVTINSDRLGCFKIKVSTNYGQLTEGYFTHIPDIDNTVMTDQYRLGYSVHFDGLKTVKEIEDEADMLKKQGCTIVRQDFLWDIIEPEDGVYDWELYDNIVDITSERNIEVLGLITYSNRQNSSIDLYNGAGNGRYRNYPPVNLENWGRYVYDTVSRYKDKINKWEIWNEANIFYWQEDPDITQNADKYRADAYLPLLKVSYLAAKAADPDCIVTMSGMSDIGVGFVNRLLENGGRDYMDVLSIHPYMAESVELTDSWSDRNFEKKILVTRDKAPELPIYLTEWGWNTEKGTSFEDSAIWNVKGIVYSRVCDVKVNTLYSFNMTNGTGFGHIMPCVNGYAKPQFAAVAACNSLLGDRTCLGVLEINKQPYFGAETFAAYFERDGELPVIALWNVDENSEKSVNIDTEKAITLYDMYGNAQTVQPKNGTAHITLDNRPVYLKGDFENINKYAAMRFEQTDREEKSIKTIVQSRTDYYFSTERILENGHPYTLKIRLVNYSGSRTSGEVQLEGLPESWLSDKNLKYDIENGKSCIISVNITPQNITSGRTYTLKVFDENNYSLESAEYMFKGR